MKSDKPVTKDEVIAALVNARAKIRQAAVDLPFEKQDAHFLGVWGIKELLAHLIGWDYTNLQACQSILAGELPEFFAHFNPDWRNYNTALVAKYKIDDYAPLIAALDASHNSLLSYLQALPEQDFDFDFGVRAGKTKVTIAWLLRAEAHDEEKHALQIISFLEQ